MPFLCTRCIKTIKSRRSSLSICLLYLGIYFTNFIDIGFTFFHTAGPPKFRLCSFLQLDAQVSFHMDFRPGSDNSIIFCSIHVVFNYVNTFIQGLLQKFLKLLLSPKFYYPFILMSFKNLYIGIWYSRLKKVVEMETI